MIKQKIRCARKGLGTRPIIFGKLKEAEGKLSKGGNWEQSAFFFKPLIYWLLCLGGEQTYEACYSSLLKLGHFTRSNIMGTALWMRGSFRSWCYCLEAWRIGKAVGMLFCVSMACYFLLNPNLWISLGCFIHQMVPWYLWWSLFHNFILLFLNDFINII